jgi:hypothetical protein
MNGMCIEYLMRAYNGEAGLRAIIAPPALEYLVREHLMTDSCEITERGRVAANALMNVPLPVQAWVMPGRS